MYIYTTHNKLRIFGYGFNIFGELYMSCTNDFVCDHSIVLWYEMYLFGVVSFIVFAGHACKEQGCQNNKMYYLLLWRTSAYFFSINSRRGPCTTLSTT